MVVLYQIMDAQLGSVLKTHCFPCGSAVKNLPTVYETWGIRSLVWEDFLEKEIATHSNVLAWEIPWTEEPDRL